ncbi:MAG: phosphatidic acid phosphatase, partial [Myxococcaceae bacterium]
MLASSLLVLAITASAPNVHPLKFHLVGDSVATGVGAAAWLSTEYVFKKQLAPPNCRWCDRNGLEDTLNPIDRWGRGI